jgi:hypothetical protein
MGFIIIGMWVDKSCFPVGEHAFPVTHFVSHLSPFPRWQSRPG